MQFFVDKDTGIRRDSGVGQEYEQEKKRQKNIFEDVNSQYAAGDTHNKEARDRSRAQDTITGHPQRGKPGPRSPPPAGYLKKGAGIVPPLNPF